MPITTTAIEDGQIVLVKIVDPWTVIDLLNAQAEDKAIRDASSRRIIHAIVDVQQSHKTPPNAILTGRRTPAMVHPTAGNIAVCGAGTFTKSIADTVFRVARYQRVKFCSTYDEALSYLRSIIEQSNG